MLPEPTLDFFNVHLEASKCNEHVRRLTRIILHPFAMWSSLTPPTTTGAPPLGCLIGRCFSGSEDRPSFATTLLSQASLVSMLTLQRLRLDSDSCAIPNSGLLFPSTSRGNWLTRESGLNGHGSQATTQCLRPLRTPPYPGVQPGRLWCWRGRGWTLPKVSVGSFRSHAETLPSRTAKASELRPCPTLSGELSSRWIAYSINVPPRHGG